MSIEAFSAWLAATPVSTMIQEQFWIVPTIQSIHILAICAVAASALLIDLRLVNGKGEPVAAYARRYMPWIWVALVVLAVTGALMIIGEPDRTLLNWVFWTKLGLIAGAVSVTLLIQRLMARNAAFWDLAGNRGFAMGLGLASMLLWVSVIICGRWIAYVY